MQKEYKLWPAAYVDVRTGEGVTDQQEAFSVGKRPSLARIVAGVPERIRRVYLVGPRPGQDGSARGMRRWLTDGRLADEWTDGGSYLHHRTPTMRLIHRATDRALNISRAAMWFDDGDYSVHDAERAMAILTWLLRHEGFDEDACPLGSPGQTGCDLWNCTLGPRVKPEDVYPPLPEDVRQLIKHTSGQGRYR